MQDGFYTAVNNLATEARELLEQQKQDWKQLSDGYASLKTIKQKVIQFDGFTIKVQFNEGRYISSSAKVDPKSIAERKCFLCKDNLPAEQRGIYYKNDFILLCNPFPIFNEHYTIPSLNHEPQRIIGNFNTLLALAKDLSDRYVVFYNGPRCGASAPDHIHFQAGEKGFMPIDTEYEYLKKKFGTSLAELENLKIFAVNDGLRKFISIESKDEYKLAKRFLKMFDKIEEVNPSDVETMLNIIASYSDEEGWRIIILPREKHRPHYFFLEGEDKILLSPASVDIGGVMITPIEKDFNRVNKQIITTIFNEVMLNDDKFKSLIKQIGNI